MVQGFFKFSEKALNFSSLIENFPRKLAEGVGNELILRLPHAGRPLEIFAIRRKLSRLENSYAGFAFVEGLIRQINYLK